DPAGDLIVIAAYDRQRFKRPHPLDDLVRIGPVADDIPEHERPVVPSRARIGETCLERFQIRVNVGEDEIAHQPARRSMNCSTSASTPWRPASTRMCGC